ncbi:hypothetical protein Hanom_Chr06g00525931 [Helianthus anomalus]
MMPRRNPNNSITEHHQLYINSHTLTADLQTLALNSFISINPSHLFQSSNPSFISRNHSSP